MGLTSIHDYLLLHFFFCFIQWHSLMESEFKKHFNATGTKNRVTQNKQTKKKIKKMRSRHTWARRRQRKILWIPEARTQRLWFSQKPPSLIRGLRSVPKQTQTCTHISSCQLLFKIFNLSLLDQYMMCLITDCCRFINYTTKSNALGIYLYGG